MLRDASVETGGPNQPWPGGTYRSIAIDETGLVFGTGTVLAHMEASGQRVTLDTDGERLLALLSIA